MKTRLLIALILFAAACSDRVRFKCLTDDQCAVGGVHGICVKSSNACALPNADCPSGYRFDKSAGKELAGQCSPEGEVIGSGAMMSTDDMGVPTAIDMTPMLLKDLANGIQCKANSECTSGFCVDGMCCNEACEGTCRTCAFPGSQGVCTLAPAGTDPRNACDEDSMNKCGLDGTCDGAGACRYRAKDTECEAQTCSGGQLTAASRCNGSGACVAAPPRACDPYICLPDGSDCYNKCTGTSTGCGGSNVCTGGSCGKSPNGASCSSPAQCASNHCIDGRCCGDVACPACYACNVGGHEGGCWPKGVVDEPTCPHDAASTCGHTGNCDGAGGCQLWAKGTLCRAPHCDIVNGAWWATNEHSWCPGGGQSCPTPTNSALTICPSGQVCKPTGNQDNVGCFP